MAIIINNNNVLIKGGRLLDTSPPLTAEAIAFLTAAGITNSTISFAINTLVISLKSTNIWTKMIAIYPFVGGTASTHKWNLKDPRDLNAAYRLGFTGITHSNLGIRGIASGRANTFVTPRTFNYSYYDHHISIYSSSSIDENSCDFGVYSSDGKYGIYMKSNYGGSLYYNDHGYILTGDTSMVNTDSKGYYILNKIPPKLSTTVKIQRNSSILSSLPGTYDQAISASIYLCAVSRNGIGSTLYSTRQYSFASFGDSLTDSEMLSLYTMVQAFQTTLGRSV